MTKEDIALLNLPSLSLIPGYDDTQFSNVMPGIELQPVDIRPQTKSTLDSMRNNATMDLFSGKNRGGDTLDKIIAQSNSKINISGGFANVYDTHDQLSDGSFTPKYKNYIKGVDNNARLASTQSSMERFFNPVLRGATKVARGIPLDIASFVYGVGDAIGNGRFENLYDNDLAKWGDDLDKRTDNSFSNYYTQDQSKLTNPTYLWDKTLGGAEFTARMIGSEALIAVATGGTSVAGSIGKMSLKGLAKAGRVAEALDTAGDIARVADKAVDVVEVGNKGSKVLKTLLSPFSATAKKGGNFSQNVDQMMGVMNTINKDYKYRELLKTGRFALTGSAYEAGFEARHFENEAQQAFWNYHRENGTTPTTEEIGQFYTKLDGQANNVFAINMGLLSVSNIALFGNMLNIKSPFGKIFGKIGDKTSAKLFGQGIEEVGEKGVATAIKANLGQKALAYANPIAKGFFTEGVFEEGGQGIASNMMKNYVASAYDPQAMRDTATYANAFSKAFKDQFNTKEGTEEIIIGGIIGGLFGGVGGIRETNRDYKKQNTKANIQTYINQNKELLYTDANLASLFASTSRNATLQQQLDKAVSENKITESSLKQAETFVSMLESAYSVGKEGDIVDVLTSSLQGADNKNISERLGIDENLVDSFKQSQIEGVNSILDTYKTSRQFAENIFNGSIRGEDSVTRANMISGLSYAMTMGKVSEMTANNLFDNVRTKVKEYFGENDIYNNLNTIEVLSKMSTQEKRELSDLDSNIKNLTEESKQKALELTQLTLNKDATPEQKSANVNKQNKLQSELQILNDNISDMRIKSDLLKSSVISNFYSVKKDTIVSKEDLTDFQDKIDMLNKAISKLSDKSNAHELINNMNEFNEANRFYKQFSDLANAFTNPELQYSTYNHIFSRKRTKNKKLNDFTKEFLDNAKNVKRGVVSTYNGSIEKELENFDGSLKPSKSLRNYIENKEDELTEKEQQVLEYINDEKNSFERLLERSKLLKRKKELEEKVSELDSNSLNNIEIQKNIDVEIQKVKDRLNSEISDINTVLKELNSSDKQGVLNEIEFLEGARNMFSENGQEVEDNIDFEIAKTKAILDLHFKKDRLTQEANNEIEFLEGTKVMFPIDELIDGLTKREYTELQSIITELQNNPTTIEDLEAQNNIYKQEISSIYNDGEVDKTLKDLDKYYISDINSEVSLTEEQENRVNELLNLIRDNKLLAQSMKAPKFNNSDSLENQITSFIESNPIFSNESSPYYGSESITQNEMNEFEVLKENNEKTEEEQERYEELLTKVERLVIEDHLEFGGGTLADLMDLKSQAEQLTENSNETSIEVNERIFHEAMQPIVNNDINGFVSEYVSLVWDNSVASNGVIDGEDVTRLHNLRLENLLNRFFASNPTATVQFRELGSGEVISEVGIDEFSSEATLYDNKSGIEIVFPNGERLMKPESSRSITGSSFGYTGNINDFGLTRIASPNNNSGFDPLYEKNSQDGYSQVKSDFEVTINGVPLDFKPEVINSLTVDSKVDLVYLPEADYSIAVGQSLDDSVIVIRYKGENVGILKASKGEWGTLREKRKAVIFNGTIKGVKINETYFGLPNIEYDSNNNIVTHDASHITNLGYRKPDGSYVHTEGAKKTNVDYSLIDAVKNDGTVTPFALITFGKKKYAIPIIIENEISDMSNLIEDIINKDINNSKKVYELNEMLNKNGLYNSENKFDLEKINETEHVNKIKDILSNSEKLTNILDHEAFKKSKKRIILDLNNPFGASKFKLDLKGISNKPENDVESGKVSTKLEKEGEKEAKKVTCKKKK